MVLMSNKFIVKTFVKVSYIFTKSIQVENPTAMAVDPILARVYWADNGNKPLIEYSDLDGNRRRVLVNSALTPILTPTSIAVDFYKRHRLIWVDQKLRKIQAVNPDGTHHVVITTTPSGRFSSKRYVDFPIPR